MNIFDEIKNRISVFDVIKKYGFEVNKQNKICCPFHGEKTPSLQIHDKYFHCFGCGESGDAVKFVQLIEKIKPLEAAKKIDKDFGLVLDFNDFVPAPKPKEEIEAEKAFKQAEKMLRNEVRKSMNTPDYLVYNEKKECWNIDLKALANYIRKKTSLKFAKNKTSDKVIRYLYRCGVYTEISDDEIKGYIKSFITKYERTLQDPIKWNMRGITEVFNDLITDLDNSISIEKFNTDENIINFKNGIYNIETGELSKHSSSIYSTIQIPCDYSSNSATNSTENFDKFMNDFTEGDNEKKRFLYQYIAAVISNIYGYRFKKGLIVVGKGNSGKSVLKDFCEMLLGEKNFSNTDLEVLEKRFGTSCLYGTRLVGSSDMTNPTIKALANYKQATGGDNILIEFKGKSAFSYKYKGLFWFCCNQLPKFGGDTGSWVYERFIIYRADNTIPAEKRDKLLATKLYKEREAIVSKYIIPALNQIISNGYNFDIPESFYKELELYKKENSIVIQFFDECCIERKHDRISDSCTTKKMYDVFKEWCKDNSRNSYTPSKSEFNRQIAEMFDITDIKTKIKLVKGYRYYTFTLNEETKDSYSKVYGTDTIK